MSEIFNYFINIIPYIMDIIKDIFYNTYIAAECVMNISYWVALFILLFILNWKSKGNNILKTLQKIIYIIFVCLYFIVINITSVGEDDIDFWLQGADSPDHWLYDEDSSVRWIDEYPDDFVVSLPSTYSKNVLYMMGDEVDPYYPFGEKAYLDLLIADRNLINSVFQSNISQLQDPNQRLTKTDLYLSFKDNIENNAMKSWYKLDKEKYTKKGVLSVIRFEYLYRGIIASKTANPDLQLKWWNLCYLYGISHHKDIPFDLNDVKSHTPESLYNILEKKKEDNTLNDYWTRMLHKYPNNGRADFYTYMRIIAFVVSKDNT